MTLFYIALSKKIIPECLRLGDSFFTHMTVFGTIGKKDGVPLKRFFFGRNISLMICLSLYFFFHF